MTEGKVVGDILNISRFAGISLVSGEPPKLPGVFEAPVIFVNPVNGPDAGVLIPIGAMGVSGMSLSSTPPVSPSLFALRISRINAMMFVPPLVDKSQIASKTGADWNGSVSIAIPEMLSTNDIISVNPVVAPVVRAVALAVTSMPSCVPIADHKVFNAVAPVTFEL